MTAKVNARLLPALLLIGLLFASSACSHASPVAAPAVDLPAAGAQSKSPAQPVPAAQAAGSDLRATAVAEATAMIQSAQATAIVLQAEAKATALVEGAKAAGAAAGSAPGDAGQAGAEQAAAQVKPAPTAVPDHIELVLVTLGADGSLISVQYKGTAKAAGRLAQGNVYVVEEGAGTRYDAIPVMPLIGPLLQHPVRFGQLCNVMFTNTPPMLKHGTKVTVVLGDYKWEHVIVQ